MIKRILSFLLALTVVLSLCACSAHGGSDDLLATAQWLQNTVPEPTVNSAVSGEWLIFGLARADVDVREGYFSDYYARAASYVEEKNGILHEKKNTVYSRMILALTAIGKDPTNVSGYDLLLPLADYEKTIFQGINGAIFALLALDSGSYDIPEDPAAGIQATREMYVAYILEQELPDGGWGLSGGAADVDITAMALQALAKYQDRRDVADATERALTLLSELQNDDGGYSANGTESSESVSQVIVALTELGIRIDDARFIKTGKTLQDRLLDFRAEDGGFCHMLDGNTDLMATEQAFYALAALERATQGKNTLYCVTDVG